MRISRTFFVIAVAAAILAMVQSTHATPEPNSNNALDAAIAQCGAFTQGASNLEADVRDLKQSIETLKAQLAVVDDDKIKPIKLLLHELEGKKAEKESALKTAAGGKAESCTK